MGDEKGCEAKRWRSLRVALSHLPVRGSGSPKFPKGRESHLADLKPS